MGHFFFGGAAEIASRANRPPTGDRWTMWMGGVLFATLVCASGVYALVAWRAVATGVVLVLVGLIFHFHYFWGLHAKLMGVSEFAKNVAAFGALCGVAYGVYQFFIDFFSF